MRDTTLGTREFSAEFGMPRGTARQHTHTEDLGIMLHSIHWDADGRARMAWFTARIDHGVMYVPEHGIAVDLASTDVG